MEPKPVVSVRKDAEIAWITIDNPPVNATSKAVRQGLLDAIDEVKDSELAVLSCSGRTFVAGGDMSEFDAPPLEPHLPDVVQAIEDSVTPILALLHGKVLGGGFEIAMACAFRLAKPGTKFGLPEVSVGLIPGAGGTQRAPRLLGWDLAVELACLGKTTTAEHLLELGAIDAVSDNPAALVSDYVGHPHKPVSKRLAPPLADQRKDELTERVTKSVKGHQSPGLNLQALLWATEPYETAQPQERDLHLKLRQSAESRALRHAFFAERSATKPAILNGKTARETRHVAVIGGGLMGAGIASACLTAGMHVSMVERDAQSAAQGHESVQKILQGAVDRGKSTAAAMAKSLAKISAKSDYRDARDADLVIEAVFEDLSAKRDVFKEASQNVRTDALLATNTSYLDPNEIFAGIPGPERCLGLHFFSPAHIMKLVEVVRADETSADALAAGFAFARKLRKTPVLSGVCDGFIGNRILAAYRRAAEYLLADGAFPHEIDAAMRSFGMAMGPFQAQDMSGLQIAEANRRRQDATRAATERYVSISDRLCAAKRYGQRSGAGWYDYPEGTRSPVRSEKVEANIRDYAAETGINRRRFADTDIQNLLISAMANEGARIVEEGIAESEAAVDVVKLAGYGFPRWRGGPMHWAAQHPETVTFALSELHALSPGSWTLAKTYASVEGVSS